MESFIATLRDWQSLAGATVTATAAFAVAFLMSYINRRRDDISAAMVLVGNLTSVMGANEVLINIAKEQNVSDGDYPMWIAQRLTASRPQLSPLFDSCVAKLMPIDEILAAHLELFSMIFRGVEQHLERLERDVSHFREHHNLLRSKEDIKADAKLVQSGFALAAKHAQCAERRLSLCVLSHWPTMNRLKNIFSKSNLDTECGKLLKTGKL